MLKTLLNIPLFKIFKFAIWVCILTPGLIKPLSAQSGLTIDSVHVFNFEEKSFKTYPVETDDISPTSVIGESKYGTLNNSFIEDFDNFLNPDTTILHRVSDFYDPLDYPFSSAVKLHLKSVAKGCSGIMISDYWIATADHCTEIRQTHHNSWSPDSISAIFASPSFHNRKAHPDIGTITVDKAIFLPGSSYYPDIIFLRLPEPAGRLSGTVGMKSTAIEDIDETATSLTFGYPGVYLNHRIRPDEYENIYNGDTLFVSQNAVKTVNDRAIYINGHSNPGQSGSSLLFFRDGEWSSYGILSFTSLFGSYFNHLESKLTHTIRELMIKYDHEYTVNTEEPIIATTYQLNQNYPNPFNTNTSIVYILPSEGAIRLEVYDILGRKMATLLDGIQSEGRHTVNFDASRLSSGVYIYRLEAGSVVKTKKMTLIK